MRDQPMKPSEKQAHRRILRMRSMALLLMLALIVAAALDLSLSYKASLRNAYEKADLSSHLVSEWISESLHYTRYILHDISRQVEMSPELRSLQTSIFSEPFNQLLLKRAEADDHLLILGVNDAEGLLVYSSIAALLGKSAKDLDREYLAKARQPPLDAFKIGNAFVSSTDILNVTATYPVFSPEAEFIGFSMAGIDLSFFQQWLDRIEDPSVTITIVDSNQKILARKPDLDQVGQIVQIENLTEFIGSPESQANFRLVSPLDAADRLWSIRKIADLPFLVAVGYSTEQALIGWFQKLFIYAIGIIFVGAISLAFVRQYATSERLVGQLQTALSEVKTLSGLIPICASCKSIRDDKGYWNQVESYIHQHSQAEFSHGICPDRAEKLYPELNLNSE